MLPSTLDMVPSPSTWNPRPSTLDKKIDSLLGDGVCCEDELDDLFSRSFLLDIRGCRVYRQILASMFHYQDIRIQK